MKKKRALALVFLAAWGIAGLFGAPMPGQQVRAGSPGNLVQIHILKNSSPPEKMCEGDSAPVGFMYSIVESVDGKYVPRTGGVKATLTATATSGILDDSSWPTNELLAEGNISTNYTAGDAGHVHITIDSSDYQVVGDNAFTFEVVPCQKDISIAASVIKTSVLGDLDTEFHGKGTISIDDKGVATGGGTYQFTLTSNFNNPIPARLTCDKWQTSSGEAEFVIVRGLSTSRGLSFGIEFAQFNADPITAKCYDKSGISISYPVYPGGTVDPNTNVDLKSLDFPTGKTSQDFAFGDGWGIIWVVDRKAK